MKYEVGFRFYDRKNKVEVEVHNFDYEDCEYICYSDYPNDDGQDKFFYKEELINTIIKGGLSIEILTCHECFHTDLNLYVINEERIKTCPICNSNMDVNYVSEYFYKELVKQQINSEKDNIKSELTKTEEIKGLEIALEIIEKEIEIMSCLGKNMDNVILIAARIKSELDAKRESIQENNKIKAKIRKIMDLGKVIGKISQEEFDKKVNEI